MARTGKMCRVSKKFIQDLDDVRFTIQKRKGLISPVSRVKVYNEYIRPRIIPILQELKIGLDNPKKDKDFMRLLK